MIIGIINAMQKEHEQIQSLLSGKETVTKGRCSFVKGTLNGNVIVLAQSGIGKVNAAVGALELIHHFRPDCLINTGVAGGIDTSLHVMDVVVGDRVVYHDVDCGPENETGQVQGLPAAYESDRKLFRCASEIKTETNVVGGLICSGDQFITDHKQLAVIKSRFPEGLAVDMESGAIAQVCYLYEVPFLSFRIISDIPGGENHFNEYLNFWDTMAEKSFNVTRTFLNQLPTDLK